MKAGFSEILPGMLAAAVLGVVLLLLLILYELCRWHWQAWRAKRGAALSTKPEAPANKAEILPATEAQDVVSVDFQAEHDGVLVETFGMHGSTQAEENLAPEMEDIEQDADDQENGDIIEAQHEFALEQSLEQNVESDREDRKRRRSERGANSDRKSRKRDQVHAEESTNEDTKRASRLARKERRNAPANENDVRERRRNKR